MEKIFHMQLMGTPFSTQEDPCQRVVEWQQGMRELGLFWMKWLLQRGDRVVKCGKQLVEESWWLVRSGLVRGNDEVEAPGRVQMFL